MSVRIDLAKKRKCSACGATESGRIIFEALAENTFFDIGIVGRPKVKGERKITTGEGMAVQGFACLMCGHLDFYFELVAPPEKPPTPTGPAAAGP